MYCSIHVFSSWMLLINYRRLSDKKASLVILSIKWGRNGRLCQTWADTVFIKELVATSSYNSTINVTDLCWHKIIGMSLPYLYKECCWCISRDRGHLYTVKPVMMYHLTCRSSHCSISVVLSWVGVVLGFVNIYFLLECIFSYEIGTTDS